MRNTKEPRKYSKDWRATNMLALVKRMGAPEDIVRAADDAMHFYMAAVDLRRAAYKNVNGYQLKLKAAREARKGDKQFKVAQDWYEQNKAA